MMMVVKGHFVFRISFLIPLFNFLQYLVVVRLRVGLLRVNSLQLEPSRMDTQRVVFFLSCKGRGNTAKQGVLKAELPEVTQPAASG